MPSNSLDAAYRSGYVRVSLAPATRTNGTVSGVAVDTAARGGSDSVLAFVLTNTITDGTHTFSIEESADGSTGWAAVPAGRIQGTAPVVTAGWNLTQFEWGCATSLRYVRVVCVTTGATTGGQHTAGLVIPGSHYEAH